MKFARKALLVAATAAFGLGLFGTAAQASASHTLPSYQCTNGGDQTQGAQFGLVNLGNTQVPVNADVLLSGIGLGVLPGIVSASGVATSNC